MMRLEEAFALQLFYPSLGTVFTHIILVILIEHTPNELTIPFSLRGTMIIALGRSESTHGSSCLGEEIIQFTSGITVVFTKYKLIEKKRRSRVSCEKLRYERGYPHQEDVLI